MRYRAKPVEKDAWLWTGDARRDDLGDLPESEWASGAYSTDPFGYLVIDTAEGPARAIPGLHYAVLGTHGERYPVRRDVWEENYEAVAEQ